MTVEQVVIPAESIGSRIFSTRGRRVMVDSHLAKLYGVPTKSLNLAVKRNWNDFPRTSCSG